MGVDYEQILKSTGINIPPSCRRTFEAAIQTPKQLLCESDSGMTPAEQDLLTLGVFVSADCPMGTVRSYWRLSDKILSELETISNLATANANLSEQTVPADLASQGWRIEPSTNKLLWDWVGKSSRHRWESIKLTDNTKIVRPVLRIRDANTSFVYAHEGWGEGLHPSIETAKIWRWWWFKGQPVQVYSVSPSGSSYKGHYGWVDFHGSINDWGGPVLPRWTIEGMK